MTPITGSVGHNGQNFKRDIVRVQVLLNMMPQPQGGTLPRLKLDDMIGPKTIGAIKNFQARQFPASIPDSRIDPGQRSEKKLNELEGTNQSIPMMHVRPAANLALDWIGKALAALKELRRPNGELVPKVQAKQKTIDALFHSFNLVYEESSRFVRTRNITPQDLNFLIDKFEKTAMALRREGTFFYINTKFHDQFGDLQNIQKVEPVTTQRPTIILTFKFCDFDEVNQHGVGPKTRAGALLQGGAIAADPRDFGSTKAHASDFTFGVTFSNPDDRLHDASCFSHFAQATALGLGVFHHIPQGKTSARDQPG